MSELSKIGMSPADPLWKRAPSRDEEGKPLSDFMMLIPKLAKAPELKQQQIYHVLQGVIGRFREEVVFVDLNLKTSLLWVSVKPERGLMHNFVDAVRAEIPEALLIANQAEVLMAECGRAKTPRPRFGWWPKLLR